MTVRKERHGSQGTPHFRFPDVPCHHQLTVFLLGGVVQSIVADYHGRQNKGYPARTAFHAPQPTPHHIRYARLPVRMQTRPLCIHSAFLLIPCVGQQGYVRTKKAKKRCPAHDACRTLHGHCCLQAGPHTAGTLTHTATASPAPNAGYPVIPPATHPLPRAPGPAAP